MAWFSGEKEGASNCSVAIATLTANGSQWSAGRVVSWRVGYSNQNPVLFQDRETGILHLFHSQQPASIEDKVYMITTYHGVVVWPDQTGWQ